MIEENRPETIRILLQWVKQTPEIAGRSYDVELKSILRDGIMSDGDMENFLERLGNEKKKALDDVRDFSFARQVWKELESGNGAKPAGVSAPYEASGRLDAGANRARQERAT